METLGAYHLAKKSGNRFILTNNKRPLHPDTDTARILFRLLGKTCVYVGAQRESYSGNVLERTSPKKPGAKSEYADQTLSVGNLSRLSLSGYSAFDLDLTSLRPDEIFQRQPLTNQREYTYFSLSEISSSD